VAINNEAHRVFPVPGGPRIKANRRFSAQITASRCDGLGSNDAPDAASIIAREISPSKSSASPFRRRSKWLGVSVAAIKDDEDEDEPP
jgi:hypothetical protein